LSTGFARVRRRRDILNEATGTRATASTAGQQARLWSADGALLATTEQLCWYR
jgi:acyl-CoA thioesterase